MQNEIKLNNYRGFTLLELAISIAIIAVISIVAIPNFLKFPPKMRLNGATRVLASDLMSARMEAVKLNQSVYLEYSNVQEYRIANVGSVIKSKTLSDEFKDVQITSDFGKVSFDSRGASTGTNTINLSNASGNRNITINLAGRVIIE